MKTGYIYLVIFYFAITVACFDAAALIIIISVQALTYVLGCGTVGTEQTTEFFTCSVQFISLFFPTEEGNVMSPIGGAIRITQYLPRSVDPNYM